MQLQAQPQYTIYTDLVNALEVMGVKPSKEQLALYVKALDPFSDHVRKAAIDTVVLTINKRPLPADFANLAKQICGVDYESLKRRGTVQFKKLLEIGSDTRSVLCDDWRIVYAVNKAFGSLSMFFDCREEEVWMQKRFAEAYASVDFFLEYTVVKEYLLDNNFRTGVNGAYRQLVFLGNYETCSNILESLPNKHEFIFPVPLEQQAISLKNNTQEQELTAEQRAANQAKLNDIIMSFANRGLKFEERTA